ncbi:MAG: glycerophosphodiester phosphodiesterase [Algicola sp.]|nr:glycerophosphodiester phosphodiesterase [Algicola sp.]
MRNPLKIGHRGAKNHIAENTLESVKQALELGVDGIEIDVHRCASGELVVFHDFTLDRMTNGSGEIAKHTLLELQQLQVEGQFSIPTLEEVLNVVDKACVINIELKGKQTAEETCRILDDYINSHGWNYDQFIISSFQSHELETVYKTHKNLRLGVLTKASVSDAIEIANSVNAFAIHPNMALITKTNVAYAQELGYKVIVWTVNDEVAITRMKSYGVDGIISDNPERL